MVVRLAESVQRASQTADDSRIGNGQAVSCLAEAEEARDAAKWQADAVEAKRRDAVADERAGARAAVVSASKLLDERARGRAAPS